MPVGELADVPVGELADALVEVPIDVPSGEVNMMSDSLSDGVKYKASINSAMGRKAARPMAYKKR